jgi:energy-coupling factor transport system permease protein
MIFLYRPGSSFLHRMDSIAKSLWLLVVGIFVLVSSDWRTNAVVLAAVLFTGFVLGGVSPVLLLRRLLPLWIVALWLLVLFSVIYPGGATVLFRLGPITGTQEGFFYGLAIALRVLSLGSSSVFFAATTDPRRMANEYIEVLHVPYRMAFAFYAALRFLPMLQTEAATLRNARAIRAQGKVAAGLRDRVELLQSLTVSLLVHVIRRVQVTAIAMDGRAFGAFATRTSIDDVVRPWSGTLFALGWLAVLIVYIVVVVILGGHGFLAAPISGGH